MAWQYALDVVAQGWLVTIGIYFVKALAVLLSPDGIFHFQHAWYASLGTYMGRVAWGNAALWPLFLAGCAAGAL
jgi:hypothetical protein